MNQGAVHLLKHRVVAFNDVHGAWCDEPCALERSTDFLVFFEHQDLQSILAEELPPFRRQARLQR